MTGFCTFNVAVNIGNFCRNIYFRWVMWDGNRRRSRIIDFIEVCKTNKCLSFHFQYSLYIQIAMIDMQIDKWVGIGKTDSNEFVLSHNWMNYEVFYWKIWINNITKIFLETSNLKFQSLCFIKLNIFQGNLKPKLFKTKIYKSCIFSLDGRITKFIWS